jgi:hypothetical protein
MSGIDFVIGGTDKAGPAMAQVEKSLSRLEQKTDKLGVATSRLTKITGALAAAYAAVKAATAALGGIDAINKAYDTQADAVRGLNKALELQGANVAEQSAKLQTFAGDMQKLTGVGDEATLEFMRQASMLGVNADQLEDVTKATIGLSEVTGKGLNESLKALQKAQEGNFSAFEESFPQMKNLATAEEKLAFVTQMAAKGLEAKADASMTASGMAERASGAIGDLMEMFGALIAPIRMVINQGLKTFAESLQQVLGPAVEKANAIMENIGPIMDYVKEKVVQSINAVIAAFTFAEVVITNLGDVFELLRARSELKTEQMRQNIKHIFVEVIPTYIEWFANNFFNIINDVNDAVTRIFNNTFEIIARSFLKVIMFIASGGKGGIANLVRDIGSLASRNFLEGFEATTEALPEIVERQISQKEKDLADRIGMIGGKLGDEFSKKFADRMVKLDDELGADFNKKIDLQVNQKIADQLGGKGGLGLQPVQAAESRLLTRGPADKQLGVLERLLRKAEDISASGKQSAAAAMEAASRLAQIEENTDNTTQLVPVN